MEPKTLVDTHKSVSERISAVTDRTITSATLKTELLASGVRPTPSFISAYGPPYLAKRRAYGNPDDLAFLEQPLPQEMYLGREGLVCAVNARRGSRWELDWSPEYEFTVRCGDLVFPLSFPLTPSFYAERLPDGRLVQSLVTLYGGGSLGVSHPRQLLSSGHGESVSVLLNIAQSDKGNRVSLDRIGGVALGCSEDSAGRWRMPCVPSDAKRREFPRSKSKLSLLRQDVCGSPACHRGIAAEG